MEDKKTTDDQASGVVNKKFMLAKPIEEYESVKSALSGLAETRMYTRVLLYFCEFVGKDPDQILAERKKHLKSDDDAEKRTYERITIDFYEHLKKQPTISESAAFSYVAWLRGFFGRNYVALKFRRGTLVRPKSKRRDYAPTLGQIKEICDAADIRDKAVIILALQTGIAPVDLVDLKRADFERHLGKSEFPISLGWLQRQKTKEDYHPFLFRDSATALKRYLQNRKDSSLYLIVDRTGEKMHERSINDIFMKAVKRAKIAVPSGQRLRVYSLRKVFNTQMQNAGMPQPWIDMMMGHEVKGVRGSYAVPSEAEWLEKARKAEPFVSISRVRNMDVLREKIDEARKGDMLELIMMLEKELGRDTMKRLAQGYLALKPKIEYDEEDLIPSPYVLADAFDEYLALRKRRRGA